ncbi:MAG: acyl-CoA mutase large subunit family protein [Sumerlaeia bacterium]
MADTAGNAGTVDDKGAGSHDRLNLREEFPLPKAGEWRALAERDLNGADFDKKLVWRPTDKVAIPPMVTAEETKGNRLPDGAPGSAPFLRGTRKPDAGAADWLIHQEVDEATPEEANATIQDGLARGLGSVSLILDKAARQGLETDLSDVSDMIGRGGCTLSSINGLRIALADVDLGHVPMILHGGQAALPVLALWLALAEERDVAWHRLRGGLDFDPLAALAEFGELRAPLDLYWRIGADLVKFCRDNAHGIRPLRVSSAPYHNAGASASQELAAALAAGAEWLRNLDAQGIAPAETAKAITFSFPVGSSLFLEAGKLRAARSLWAKIVRAFGVEDEDAQRMVLYARTSSFNKTTYDPYNNMVRTALEAFAGAAAGCDALTVTRFDETVRPASEFSRRVARNQQLLLKHEAFMTKVSDPMGGSYALEALTDSLGREAWELLQGIEREGGLGAALIEGNVQKQIAATAERRFARLGARRDSIVGVTNYANPKEELPKAPPEAPREEYLAERYRRIQRLKSMRKNSEVRRKLLELTSAGNEPDRNLVALAVDAAQEGATLGEMATAIFQSRWTESPAVATPMYLERIDRDFEALRRKADKVRAETGSLPQVFLVPMGPTVMRRARVGFSHGFFAAGGFETVEPEPFETPEAAAEAAAASGAKVAVLCSDDESYAKIAKPFAAAFRAKVPDACVIVAGYPADAVEGLKADGVDDFIHLRANTLEMLRGLQVRLGIA